MIRFGVGVWFVALANHDGTDKHLSITSGQTGILRLIKWEWDKWVPDVKLGECTCSLSHLGEKNGDNDELAWKCILFFKIKITMKMAMVDPWSGIEIYRRFRDLDLDRWRLLFFVFFLWWRSSSSVLFRSFERSLERSFLRSFFFDFLCEDFFRESSLDDESFRFRWELFCERWRS